MAELLRPGGRYGDRPWVVTPDGPKGPRGSVKDGLVRMAGAASRQIRPVAGAVSRAKVFASWDRFTLPLPFDLGLIGGPNGAPLNWCWLTTAHTARSRCTCGVARRSTFLCRRSSAA